jgi:hypothetical protein
VLCLMPGFMIDEVRIRAWDEGRLLIRAAPRDAQAAALWGVQPVERNIALPGRIRANSAQALMTLHGQLYVRVNDAAPIGTAEETVGAGAGAAAAPASSAGAVALA